MVNVEVLFSKKITFSLKKKPLNQTELLQLMRNLTVAVDGGKLTRNNNRKRKLEVLQAYICPLFGKCSKRD